MSAASTCRTLFSFKPNRHAMAGALLLGIALQGWSISAAEYDVTRHGMVGDGVTLNTLALQTLIDHSATEGGGTLHFPAGDYLTGTIYLRLGNRARGATRAAPKLPVGAFRNVTLEHITATGAGTTGCSITGIPDQRIENVPLSRISIEYDGGGVSEHGIDTVPELAEKYPECLMFGTLPAYGFFCRHVDGLVIDNMQLILRQPDQRPAWVFDDVLKVEMQMSWWPA